MRLMKWGMIAVGVLATGGLLATSLLSSGGTASAEGPNDPAGQVSPFEQALAQKLGISVDVLKADQQAAFAQAIDQAVASGRITPDAAAKLKSLKPGDAREALRKRGGGRLKHAIEGLLDSAAKTIGIAPKDLKAGLKTGQSLAQIAAVHGVSPDQLKAGLTTSVQAKLQAQVAAGKLTQPQANDILARFTSHLDQLIQRQGGQHHGKAPTTTQPQKTQ